MFTNKSFNSYNIIILILSQKGVSSVINYADTLKFHNNIFHPMLNLNVRCIWRDTNNQICLTVLNLSMRPSVRRKQVFHIDDVFSFQPSAILYFEGFLLNNHVDIPYLPACES
jgi:hypothetical protein